MAKRMRKLFLGFATTLTLGLCGVFAACGEGGLGGGGEQQQPLTMVKQETMKFDGRVLTWEAVSGAEKYSITINGGAEYFSSVAQFSWPATNVDMVDVQIKAIRGEEVTSPAAKMFTRLEKIADNQIYFDETGKMTWDPVIGATEYVVRINGAESRTYVAEYVDFTYGQRNSISIMPVGPDNATFSEWSTAVSKDYLGTPTDIQYDGQFITFKGNNFASKYMIYINNNAYQEVSSTTFEYDADSKSFDVAVQSVGDGRNSFSSSISDSKTFIHLADITGFRVEDGRLSWNAVEEASGYKVRVNGVEQTTENNYVDDLSAGKENTIQVKPITTAGDAYFANWSEPQIVRLLTAPTLMWETGINLDDGQARNAIYWDKVDGDVGGYNVKIVHYKNPTDKTSEIVQLSAEKVQFSHAFEETGTYEISIQTAPVADSNSYHSAFGSTIRVIRLETPKKLQNFIESNPSRVSEGFTMNWQSVSGASGYQIWKDGDKLEGTTLTTSTKIPYNKIITSDETEAQTFQFKVQSLGSDKTFANERYVTLSSLTADMLTATINVLAQPRDLQFDGYTAKWTAVPNANGYAVNCTGESTRTDTNFDLSNLEAGTYPDFGVCARGNGGDVLASNYTPAKQIVRLSAPYNIRLRADSAGDVLEWDHANSDSQKFQIFWDSAPDKAIETDQVADVLKNITTQGSGLFMRAAANYYDEVDNTYYITSKPSDTVTFIKLDVVTFNNVRVEGTKLKWNAPSNVQGQTITYRVFKNNGMSLSGETTACEYDISGFAAGNYELKVQAVGGGRFISSDIDASPVVQFEKLQTPVVTTPENGTSLVWGAVPGEVVQYVITVDGKVVDYVKPESGKYEYSYEYKYSSINPIGYQVSVYAQGDGMRTVDSAAWERKQVVKAANIPGFEINYCNQNGEEISFNEPNAKFVITIYNLAHGYTTGYEIEINGTTKFVPKSEGENTLVEYKPDQTGTCAVRVYAMGGVYDANGVYYVRSETEDVKKLTVHPAPKNVQIYETQIKWDAVQNAGKYLLRYFANGAWVEVEVDGAVYNLPSEHMGAVTKVEVRALGNGYDTVGSVVAEKSLS